MPGKGTGSNASLVEGTAPGILIVVFIGSIGILLKEWGGDAALTAWGQYFAGAGTVGLVFGAVYAAVVAIKEYRQSIAAARERIALDKAKWLSQLFEKFYQERHYKDIRRRIDFGNIQEILELLAKDDRLDANFSEKEQQLFDEFTDYLNLFEFVAYLKELKQLESEDIKAIFAYYMERLIEVDSGGEIRRYLDGNGYGNLSRMLKGYGK